MRFRAETPLCDIDRDFGTERLNILAAAVRRGECLGDRPESGPIPDAVLTFAVNEEDVALSLAISFTSDEELRCVHEHSLIRPALERRGYQRVHSRDCKPARPGQPVPRKHSRWLKDGGEILTVDLVRRPHFSSLKLVRSFDPNRPFQRPKIGLEAHFF